MKRLPSLISIVLFVQVGTSGAVEPTTVSVWPSMAPGESSIEPGTELPRRPTDRPPITRVEKITQPTVDVFPADKPNGTAMVILPGGGFRYVVPDLEGSEVAAWMNPLGISVFVLRYRTTDGKADDPWRRPLQDSQRAIRWLRSEAAKWHVDVNRIGLFGFSAGGQVAAIHLTHSNSSYEPIDEIDQQSFRPDFGMLVYPWQIYDVQTDDLIGPINVDNRTPPTFIVHTHDDRSSSLGAVQFYIALKKLNISSELHVYQNGGHGYGSRSRPDSVIGTWKDRAVDWLSVRKLAGP